MCPGIAVKIGKGCNVLNSDLGHLVTFIGNPRRLACYFAANLLLISRWCLCKIGKIAKLVAIRQSPSRLARWTPGAQNGTLTH
jgi:hypothetical protein